MSRVGRSGDRIARGGRAGRTRRSITWGFVDQGFSSATNFGLSLLAGRALGPAGLGGVFLGFSAYLITLGLQRRLLTEPLLAASSTADDETRRRSASLGLTTSICAGIGATVGVLGLGMVIPGFAGRGLWLIAPWIAPALVQDLWRNVLFRDGRGASAALNDGVWVVVMAACVPIAWALKTDWAVTGAWGLGALAAVAFGFVQTRVRPHPVGASLIWWRREAWPFGKWNAGAAAAANIGGNIGAFVLSGIIGASALGGLRAAQTVFAPLTLIVPAIALPGLPAVSRALHADVSRGRRLALGLSGVALGATTLYVVALLLGAWRLLPLLFGDAFAQYRELIWPIAAGQLCIAAGVGIALILKAKQLGRLLLLNRAVAAVVGLALVTLLASRYGVLGAAWGGAAGHLASTLILAWSSLRSIGPVARPDPPPIGSPASPRRARSAARHAQDPP